MVFKPSIEVNFISGRNLCLELQLLLSKSSELIISTLFYFLLHFFLLPCVSMLLPILVGFLPFEFSSPWSFVLVCIMAMSSGFVRELNSQCWKLSQRSSKCKRQSIMYTPLFYSILLYLVAVFSSVSFFLIPLQFAGPWYGLILFGL